jgi:protein-tyrosine phosphatase
MDTDGERKMPPIPESYWVLPERFLAGEYPGESEREMTRRRLRALIAGGIRTFIDLTEEHEAIPPYRGVLREVSEEESVETTYSNVPIEDRGVPSPSTLQCILDAIDRAIVDENPVYVHCWAGLGRTGTVVGCYLKRHGMAEDGDVIEKLAALRQGTPSGGVTSPDTKEQIRLVMSWKKGA